MVIQFTKRRWTFIRTTFIITVYKQTETDRVQSYARQHCIPRACHHRHHKTFCRPVGLENEFYFQLIWSWPASLAILYPPLSTSSTSFISSFLFWRPQWLLELRLIFIPSHNTLESTSSSELYQKVESKSTQNCSIFVYSDQIWTFPSHARARAVYT